MHRAPYILLGSRTRSYGTPIRRLLLSEDRGHNRSSEVFALMFSCWRALHERHWANLSAQHILLIPPLSQETGYLMFKPSSLLDLQYFKLFYNGDIPACSRSWSNFWLIVPRTELRKFPRTGFVSSWHLIRTDFLC